MDFVDYNGIEFNGSEGCKLNTGQYDGVES